MQGGTEFLIALGGVLLEDINYAYFGEHRVELKKLNTLNLTGIIPGKYLQNSSFRNEIKNVTASVCSLSWMFKVVFKRPCHIHFNMWDLYIK